MNAGIFGISLLAYASWQTLHLLNDKGSRVWARQRFHRYTPRPSGEDIKNGKSCSSCIYFKHHPDFFHSGKCSHEDWKVAMRSDEVLVKRDGNCELYCSENLSFFI